MIRKSFKEWILAKEMTAVAKDPKADAEKANKVALATKKYQLDLAKLAQDPTAKKNVQNQIMKDPQLGPDVAVDIFKNL